MKKITVNMVSESEISVQGHGVHTAYEEMAAALEKRSDVELIRGEFGRQVSCDIVHLHTVGPRTYKKLFQRNVKKVISAHIVPGSLVGSLVGANLWKGLASLYLRWFYNRADLLIAVSSATSRELKSMGVKAPIKVIDNAIDTSGYRRRDLGKRSKVRRQLGIPDDAFLVMGAGQVQPRKRVDRFVAAATALPDVEFMWVGGMPFGKAAASYKSMQAMMDTAPGNMHFPGIVPLEMMPDYYWAADVFWLPSQQETFGLVVVEAAASGLPIVLRDIPDYDDTFSGFVEMADDSRDISVIEKLSKDRALYSAGKRRAAQLAKKYDSQRATDVLVEEYRRLLEA